MCAVLKSKGRHHHGNIQASAYKPLNHLCSLGLGGFFLIQGGGADEKATR